MYELASKGEWSAPREPLWSAKCVWREHVCMDGYVPLFIGGVVGVGGGGVGYKPSYVVAWARHGACHACPLGHFINSARGQVTLYMMASRYSCLVRGMVVSSGSCRCRVGLQTAAGWSVLSAAGWAEQSDGSR